MTDPRRPLAAPEGKPLCEAITQKQRPCRRNAVDRIAMPDGDHYDACAYHAFRFRNLGTESAYEKTDRKGRVIGTTTVRWSHRPKGGSDDGPA